jgi:hypothetical protein
MKEPRSTEARLFARQVAREVKRRERVLALKLMQGLRPRQAQRYAQHVTVKDASWAHGLTPLMVDFRRLKESAPKKRFQLLKRVAQWLDDIPLADRGYALRASFSKTRFSGQPRYGGVSLITLVADDHPMQAMTGQEEGIVAHWHGLRVERGGGGLGIVGYLQAYVSSHALERLYDRWPLPTPPGLDAAIGFIHFAWKAAEEANERSLIQSGICFPFYPDRDAEPLYAEGRMWLTDNKKYGEVCHWFDCRTVLTREMLQPDQLAQAEALNAAFLSESEEPPVPATAPRDNYVSRVLDALD